MSVYGIGVYIGGQNWKRERENIVVRGRSEVNERVMRGLWSNRDRTVLMIGFDLDSAESNLAGSVSSSRQRINVHFNIGRSPANSKFFAWPLASCSLIFLSRELPRDVCFGLYYRSRCPDARIHSQPRQLSL